MREKKKRTKKERQKFPAAMMNVVVIKFSYLEKVKQDQGKKVYGISIILLQGVKCTLYMYTEEAHILFPSSYFFLSAQYRKFWKRSLCSRQRNAFGIFKL